MSIYVKIIDSMSNATAADVTSMLTNFLLREGVLSVSGDHYEVTEKGTPDMSVDVATGIGWVLNDSFSEFSSSQKFWEVLHDATTNKAISSNASGSTRVDLVCIKVDDGIAPGANGENAATIEIVAGTPGAGAPAVPNDHTKLAEVEVANGASSITNANITDYRAQTGLDASKAILANATYIKALLAAGTLSNIIGINASDQLDNVLEILATLGIDIADGQNVKYDGADPWRTIMLTPGFLKPTTTDGCSAVTQVEAGTNDIDYDVLDFDASSDENAYANLQMPDSWDGGVIQFRYIWTNAGGGAAETVVLELSGRSYANDDAIDQAVGTAIEVSDTWIAQGDIHISAWSGDVTLAGGPAAGEWVHLELMRDVSEDDLTGDARLIGIQIRYKQTQFGD